MSSATAVHPAPGGAEGPVVGCDEEVAEAERTGRKGGEEGAREADGAREPESAHAKEDATAAHPTPDGAEEPAESASTCRDEEVAEAERTGRKGGEEGAREADGAREPGSANAKEDDATAAHPIPDGAEEPAESASICCNEEAGDAEQTGREGEEEGTRAEGACGAESAARVGDSEEAAPEAPSEQAEESLPPASAFRSYAAAAQDEERGIEEATRMSRQSSLIFVDTGKAVKRLENGMEEETCVFEYEDEDEFLSELEEGDDGKSFLAPVRPFSPVEMPNARVVSEVQMREDTRLKVRPRRSSLSPVSPENLGLPGSRTRSMQALSELAKLGGSVVSLSDNDRQGSSQLSVSGSMNYGGGSMNYGGGSMKYGGNGARNSAGAVGLLAAKSRALSFADEAGRDLHEVHETEHTHYAIRIRDSRRCMRIALAAACLVVSASVLGPLLAFAANASSADEP